MTRTKINKEMRHFVSNEIWEKVNHETLDENCSQPEICSTLAHLIGQINFLIQSISVDWASCSEIWFYLSAT